MSKNFEKSENLKKSQKIQKIPFFVKKSENFEEEEKNFAEKKIKNAILLVFQY